MTPRRLLSILAALLFAPAMACEKPPPEPPDPEHEACLEKAEAYLDCQTKQAAQAGPAEDQILRSVKANRRKAGISLEKCESVLSKVPADDQCAPD